MEQFTIHSDDDSRFTVTGRLFLSEKQSSTPYAPLVVAVHGATYDSEYWACSSAKDIALALGVSLIAIDRPSYGDTALPNDFMPSLPFLERSGHYLVQVILPMLWTKFGGERTGTTSMVLLSHSAGSAVSIVASSLHSLRREGFATCPLSGVIISGIGLRRPPDAETLAMYHSDASTQDAATISKLKDAIMLRPALGLCSQAMLDLGIHLNRDFAMGEKHDIANTWETYWKSHASKIQIPILYGIGEHDCFYQESDGGEMYRAAFEHCSSFEGSTIPAAPHCIELSLQGQAWLAKCLAFAQQCAIGTGLQSRLKN